MIDRYEPSLASFSLTEDEQLAVTFALKTGDPWGWKPDPQSKETIESVKTKIRNHHLKRHGSLCCYCRVNLFGAGHFMTDREHILPKSVSQFKVLSYTIWNLGIACKRCNLEYKKARTDFVVDIENADLLKDSANYRLIHPNFDYYREHIYRSVQQSNDAVLVKYTVITNSKGQYTYDFFNLVGLEVNSFDKAQGLQEPIHLGVLALKVRNEAMKYGQ